MESFWKFSAPIVINEKSSRGSRRDSNVRTIHKGVQRLAVTRERLEKAGGIGRLGEVLRIIIGEIEDAVELCLAA